MHVGYICNLCNSIRSVGRDDQYLVGVGRSLTRASSMGIVTLKPSVRLW